MNALFYKFIAVAHAADPWYNGLNQFVNNQPPTVEKVQFNSSIGLDPYLNALHCTAKMDGSFLGCYIAALYSFFVQGAIVLAVVMIMFGGFQWLLAAGNSSKISEAKSTISAAIFGLILALTSYLLFAQINSKLVELQNLDIETVPISTPSPNFIGSVAGFCRENPSGFSPDSLTNIKPHPWILGATPQQYQSANPDLEAALRKLDGLLGGERQNWAVKINSISDSKIFSGKCSRSSTSNLDPVGDCSHGGSWHYGGPQNNCRFDAIHPPSSCAVDLSVTTQRNYRTLEALMKAPNGNFTMVQCETSGANPRAIGCTAEGLIGHIHGQIATCQSMVIPDTSSGGSGSYGAN